MFAGSAQTGVYESGVFSYHNQRSFAWARVDGDFTSGTLTVYADGSTVATLTMAANTPQRMPPTRGRKWHVRWSDTERATRILLASSTGELVVNG
jgi:glycine cleavage system aminomethyltransferase T